MRKLRKRNGIYYADYDDRDGRRRQPSLGTGDLKLAKARLRDLELSTTGPAPTPTESMRDALDYFIDITIAAKPASTRSCYTQKSQHVERLLGDKQLDALTTEDTERYIKARLDDGAHPHTIHKELVVLRGALRAAEARGRFHGVIQRVVPKFDAQYEPRKTALSFEQFVRLTDHLLPPVRGRLSEASRKKRDQIRSRRLLYCMLVAYASPRSGEIEAMTWGEHVKMETDRLYIPDGKTVPRPIAIAAELRPWLQLFGDRAGWQGPVVGRWSNVRRDLPDACARAGVPRCTPNDLRRTFASWLVNQHVSLFVIASLMGHSSTRMLERVYGRLDQATLDRAVATLPSSSTAAPSPVPPAPAAAPVPALDGLDGALAAMPPAVRDLVAALLLQYAPAPAAPSTEPRHTGATEALGSARIFGTGRDHAAALLVPAAVEDPSGSAFLLVPRDGVEPPTRGFSGPASADPGRQSGTQAADMTGPSQVRKLQPA